jgi:hypothetical protein
MRPTYVIRTRWARAIAVVGWAACLAYAVSVVADRGTIATGHLAWPALAALLVHALWWRPAVEVSDGGITVRDLLRTTHVPWPAVREIGERWSLSIVTPSGQVGSWALPASSPARRAQREARARRRGEVVEDPGFTAGDVEATVDPTPDGGTPVERVHGTAEDAAQIARDRMASLRSAGHLGADGPVPEVTHAWHGLTGLAVIGLLVVAALG